ncbi:MAG: CoA-binding protein [Desulfobacteraceae bacterium]|nr:CoA-binding protein [Desulfobacteraceae bacterium]
MESNERHFLDIFFNPESVAIVGASKNPASINHNLIANLVNLGYEGRIFPVNPKEKEILGIKTYSNISDIEENVDLAVISLSNSLTPKVLEECVKKGIKRVTLVAGGFSETGLQGKTIQKQMAELLQKNGVRAIGPNALSPINVPKKFAISFHPIKRIKQGNLSLIFQSGLYEARFNWLFNDFNLHINKLIDLGNKMDINEVDALSYIIQDPLTQVIGMHLESIDGDGREFFTLIREAKALGKHVVIIKTGRTETGARAAASHTGALVRGSDKVLDGVLKQSGALRVDTIEEFFEICRGLDRFGSLKPKGNCLSLAMLPGGMGVMITDLCERQGLKLASVEDATIEKLRALFPPWDIAPNPWDLGVTMQFGDPLRVFQTWIDAMSHDPNVDMLAIQIPDRMVIMPKEFFEIFHKPVENEKPIVIWVTGIDSGTNEVLEWLEEKNIPVFRSPEKAISSLVALFKMSSHN